MTVEIYYLSHGCTSCSRSYKVVPYVQSLQDKYTFELKEYNTSNPAYRQMAEQYRQDLPSGQFYFPLLVVNGVGRVCGYKPNEIEEAIKGEL